MKNANTCHSITCHSFVTYPYGAAYIPQKYLLRDIPLQNDLIYIEMFH